MIRRVPSALYTRDGSRYVPSEWTRSPWSPDSQHGGAPAALIVGALEAHVRDADPPLQVARATFEFVKPVPLTPLSLRVSSLRSGARVRLLEATMSDGDGVVARARCVMLRVADLHTWDVVPPREAPPAPDPSLKEEAEWPWEAFHSHAMDLVFVGGEWLKSGPATVWLRMRVPVLDDEPVSPAQRACAAADFGNGVSAVLPFGKWLFINPDLTVYLERPPNGEWVCLDARTYLTSNGIAMSESELFDVDGRIGRSAQSLLVDKL